MSTDNSAPKAPSLSRRAFLYLSGLAATAPPSSGATAPGGGRGHPRLDGARHRAGGGRCPRAGAQPPPRDVILVCAGTRTSGTGAFLSASGRKPGVMSSTLCGQEARKAKGQRP